MGLSDHGELRVEGFESYTESQWVERKSGGKRRTSNREFRAPSQELQEVSPTILVVEGHDLDQVSNGFTLDVESMICLDNFT